MPSRADYIHKIKDFNGTPVLTISDLNLGNVSVTNDIENVVKDIEVMEKINADEFVVVYKDSDDIWDGWNNKLQEFVGLRQADWWNAVRKYQSIYSSQNFAA